MNTPRRERSFKYDITSNGYRIADTSQSFIKKVVETDLFSYLWCACARFSLFENGGRKAV